MKSQEVEGNSSPTKEVKSAAFDFGVLAHAWEGPTAVD